MSKKAMLNDAWCKSCGYCIAQCPKKALMIGNRLNAKGYKYVVLDPDKCIGCGMCYAVCPDYVFSIVDDEEG